MSRDKKHVRIKTLYDFVNGSHIGYAPDLMKLSDTREFRNSDNTEIID